MPGSGFGFDFTPIVARGAIGVYLFFVLSGFLLSQSWLKADFHGKPRPKLLKYFKLRILRIVPAYYVCLLFLLIFFVPRVIPAP